MFVRNKGQLKERKTFLLILAALLQGRVFKNLSETKEKEKERKNSGSISELS
jgi:hypothetical protein